MKVLSGLLGAFLLMGLVACPKHVELKVIDLDQGALHIVPVKGISPRITRAQAASEFDRFSDQLVTGSVVPVLGNVTTRVSVLFGSPRPQNLRVRLVWAYVTHPDYSLAVISCPSGAPASPTPIDSSNAVVFMIDATTGDAYDYVGSGRTECGFVRAEPELKVGLIRVSVPWSYRNRVFRVTLPPCGRLGNFGAGYVYAIVPFGTCNKKDSVFVRTNVILHMGSNIAPVGVVCGPAYDAIITRPKSCLNGIAPGGIFFP